MRKLIFILFSSLTIQHFCFSQEFIILKNNDTIKCTIIEERNNFVIYKLFEYDTVIYRIASDSIDYYYSAGNAELTESSGIVLIKQNKNKYPINSRDKKKGVYLKFEDFINNRPSFDFEFVVKERSRFSKSGAVFYRVVPVEKHISRKRIKKEFWGICDGISCYINCRKFSKIKNYSMMTIEGDHSYFYAIPSSKKIGPEDVLIPVMFGVAGAVIYYTSDNKPFLNLIHIDYKTGKITLYNQK